MQFLSDFTQTFRTVRWFDGDSRRQQLCAACAAVPPIALSFGAFATLPRRMNLLSISDESAASRGVDVHRIAAPRISHRIARYRRSSVTRRSSRLHWDRCSHLIRLIGGADHRLVLPASAFGGDAFLVACDTVSRTVLAPWKCPLVWSRPSSAAHSFYGCSKKAIIAIVLLACFVAQAQTRPQRIISIIPSTTEMLFAIGAGPRVIGVGNFDRYPPEALTRTKVGGLIDPDVERIISLKPDLVVVYGTQSDLRTQMERASIPIFLYQHAGLADITTTIRELGARVGNVKESTDLAGRIEADISDIRKRVGGRPRPRTLLVFGRDAETLRGIYASGALGFLHDMLEAAGGANVFDDVKRQSIQATSELAITRAPEVILEIGAETASAKGRNLSAWDALGSVPAVRNKRIYLLTVTA